MENVSLIFDAEKFDATVHGRDGVRTLPDDGQLRLIVKDGGMESGAACVCLTFGVQVDGKVVRAQTVTSMKLLMGALRGLAARYNDRGTRRADDA